jgi:large subunit ribosomal protein L15
MKLDKYCLQFARKTMFNFSMFKKADFSTGIIKQNHSNEINFFSPITHVSIKDNKGARQPRSKFGRGPGSGKGKTSARGHKGFKARVGNVNRHYEGGQNPWTRRIPKHGFRRRAIAMKYEYLNIERICYLISKGRLNAQEPITTRHLYWAGAVSKMIDGIKLLSRGSELLKDFPPIHIEISVASQKAIEEIKKHNGTVTISYKGRLGLRAQVKPWKFYKPVLDALPKQKIVKKLLTMEEYGAMYDNI